MIVASERLTFQSLTYRILRGVRSSGKTDKYVALDSTCHSDCVHDNRTSRHRTANLVEELSRQAVRRDSLACRRKFRNARDEPSRPGSAYQS